MGLLLTQRYGLYMQLHVAHLSEEHVAVLVADNPLQHVELPTPAISAPPSAVATVLSGSHNLCHAAGYVCVFVIFVFPEEGCGVSFPSHGSTYDMMSTKPFCCVPPRQGWIFVYRTTLQYGA